jgi:hypothetical protein
MSEIEPGEGWRLIDNQKDTPREGDEFWSVMFQEWGPLWQGEAFLTGYTYRRRIPGCGEESGRKDKPTMDELVAYCCERGGKVDPQSWMDHYTANGWKVGKNPMKDWKAEVRQWKGNSNER